MILIQVIDRLKENLVESRRLVFAATETIFELLHLSLTKADHDVQSKVYINWLYYHCLTDFWL